MLTGYIGDIDVQIEKIHRLIGSAGRDDPEIAAGVAVDMSSVQRRIDLAAAACETLDAHVRDIMRAASK
jgi:hypothetical protein